MYLGGSRTERRSVKRKKGRERRSELPGPGRQEVQDGRSRALDTVNTRQHPSPITQHTAHCTQHTTHSKHNSRIHTVDSAAIADELVIRQLGGNGRLHITCTVCVTYFTALLFQQRHVCRLHPSTSVHPRVYCLIHQSGGDVPKGSSQTAVLDKRRFERLCKRPFRWRFRRQFHWRFQESRIVMRRVYSYIEIQYRNRMRRAHPATHHRHHHHQASRKSSWHYTLRRCVR